MARAKSLPLISRLARWRVWVQASFLLVWLDPLMLRIHNVCGPVFHCYSCPLATFACPIGVIANFGSLHVFPFIAVGTLLVVGGVLGSFICGWVCPFGFAQDLIGRAPTPKFHLPAWTGHFRFVVLGGLVLAIPFFFGAAHPLFICSVCPAGALEAAVPHIVKRAVTGQTVVWPNAIKMTVMILVVTAMFFTWRPWCRLFCPLGAIYGLFNRASVLFLRFRPAECIACGLCHERCRYGLHPDRSANDSRCVRCLECTGCSALGVGCVLRRSGAGETDSASAPAC